jgi:hypothetical protein
MAAMPTDQYPTRRALILCCALEMIWLAAIAYGIYLLAA